LVLLLRDFIKNDPYFIFFSTAYHHEKIINENGTVPFSWASNNLIKKYDYSHLRDHLSMLHSIRLFTPRSNEFLFCSFSRFYSLLLEAEINTESCQDYCLAFISSFEDGFQQVLLDWILENAKRQDVPLVSSQPFPCPKNRSFLVKLIPDSYLQFYWCFGNDWRILNGLWFNYNDEKETAPNTSIKTRQHRNPNMSNVQKRPRDFLIRYSTS
jgi:hypothetical protein